MQIAEKRTKITGFTGLIISAILLIFFSSLSELLADFISKYLSPDNYVKPGSIIAIKIYYTLFILSVIVLSLFFLLNVWKKIKDFTESIVDTKKVKEFFLTDEICPEKRLPGYLMVIGTVPGVLLFMYYLLKGRPQVEGIFENFSTLLLFVSAIILTVSGIRIRKKEFPSVIQKKIVLRLIIFSVLLLILVGEETSWGQHYWRYQTNAIIEKINFQGETNVHNIFNPFFPIIYPVAGCGFFIVMWILWVFKNEKKPYLLSLFLPPPGFFFLIFLMACSSTARTTEIFEELFYLLIFLYSIRIFICLNNPKTDLIS